LNKLTECQYKEMASFCAAVRVGAAVVPSEIGATRLDKWWSQIISMMASLRLPLHKSVCVCVNVNV
jgi:hypothetical protein